MIGLRHGFGIDRAKCRGCLSCMRICPTRAIRVRQGKAEFSSDHCIDCGSCLPACPSRAIAATTWSMTDTSRFKFKVAVPSPVLFGQFPAGITPAHIVDGLLAIGFDAVWDYGVEVGLVSCAIRDYVERWKGPFPLISVACPVIVRLVQVSYPRMVDQLVCVQPPREIAGRELKQRYSEALGLSTDEIAAIYISACQAKTISIFEPAEEAESYLDGALGIADVYNPIVARANIAGAGAAAEPNLARNSSFLRWCLGDGLSYILSRQHYLHVTGLQNVTQVFDDIEKGRLRNVDFVEAHSCWSGCTGGNLTVANVYVTQSKLYSLMNGLPEIDESTRLEIESRFPNEKFALDRPVRPRPIRGSMGNLRQRIAVVREAEEILSRLPGLNCGLCGAPTCRDLAKDVSMGDAARSDCIFASSDRLSRLQKMYLDTAD